MNTYNSDLYTEKKNPKEPEGAPGGLYPGAKKVASKSKKDKGGSPKGGGKK